MDVREIQGTTTELIGPRLAKLQTVALGMAAAGVVLCAVGAFLERGGFFHSYLFGYLFWIGVTCGSLAFLMLHHVVGGGWGYVLRRFLEAATRMLPWMAGLFLPIVVGLVWFHLYEWAHPAHADGVLEDKSPYLNIPFFLTRQGVYFTVWILFAFFLCRWGARQEESDDPRLAGKLNRFAAIGLVVYVLTTTFAAVDWVMSLTPHWYSTIFGLLTVVSQGLSTLALMLVLVGLLGRGQPLLREAPGGSGNFRDLGNLMLAFVLLWAYMSFSQFLITYSGNTAEEVPWYIERTSFGWGWVSLTLIAFHFALPFLVLLMGSRIKRNPLKLAMVAGFLILMRLTDLYWWVTPTFRRSIGIGPADFGAPLLIGGIWLWLWASYVRGRTLVPARDPRILDRWQEVVEHG